LLVSFNEVSEVGSGVSDGLQTSGDDVDVAAAASQQFDEVETMQLHLKRRLSRRHESTLGRIVDRTNLWRFWREICRRSAPGVELVAMTRRPFERRTLK
jgi:hypothetical protein